MSVLFKNGLIVNATGRYAADVFAEGDKIKFFVCGWDLQSTHLFFSARAARGGDMLGLDAAWK